MRFNEFLLEYVKQMTLQNWSVKIATAWAKEKKSPAPNEHMAQEIAFQLLPQIEQIDPTPHKEYVPWLCRAYATGQTKFEDLTSRGKDSLVRFQKLKIKKQLAPEHRDINRFKTLQQLEQALDQYPDVEDQQTNKGKAVEYYKDADLRIIIPQDETAACYYGQGTKWCTAAKSNNMFNQYNKQGPLYIIIPTKVHHTGEKYQFHFESGQFMDDTDTQIDLYSWAKAYPQLRDIFQEQAKKNLIVPLLKNSAVLKKKFTKLKNQLHSPMHKLLMTDVSLMISSLRKDFRGYGCSIRQARELSEAVMAGLQYDARGLMSNLVFLLDFDCLQDEDHAWDTLFYPIENWVSENEFIGGAIGEMLDTSDDEVQIDEYGLANSITHDIYEKVVPPTIIKIKQELQPYIE